jgi:cytochrome P450
VEELLRFESPLQLNNRRRHGAGGHQRPRAAGRHFVTLGIGAANRDPAEFPDPDGWTWRASRTTTWPSARARMPARA